LIQQGVERFRGGGAESMSQTGSQNLLVRDSARTNGDVLVKCKPLYGLVEMTDQDSAGAEIPSKVFPGDIPVASQEFLAMQDCCLKRKILQAVKRVVMYESAHGPVLRNHFAGDADNAAKFHAPGAGVYRAFYWIHAGGSIPTAC
jgi:hypothetical protein